MRLHPRLRDVMSKCKSNLHEEYLPTGVDVFTLDKYQLFPDEKQ
jgi:hypothetical protein